MKANFILHVLTTVIGYILVLTGGRLMSRIINVKLNADICSKENETFPYGRMIIKNEFSGSHNLPKEISFGIPSAVILR